MKRHTTLSFSKTITAALSFLTISLSILFAQQTHEWVAGYQGTDNVNGQNLVTDENNNVYSVGQFFGTVDFDPGPGNFDLTSPNQNDVYVTKLDQNGVLDWAFRIGNASRNRGNNVTIDQNGDIYVVGYFEGTVDFDPGPGLFEMTSQFVVTAFLLKIDQAGNFIWARQFGGPNGVSEALSVRVDSNNDVVVGGYFTGECNFDPLGLGVVFTSTAGRDGFLVKHNELGGFIWARHLEGDNDNRINSIDIDNQNNIVCGGFFQGNLNFDNLTPSASIETADGGGQDIFVGKFGSTGNYLWSRSIGGTGADHVNGIVVNRFGNVFATGQFQNTVDFDPSAGISNLTSLGALESYVWSLDENGLYNWSERIGGTAGDLGLGITKDPQGSVYVTGYFNNTGDFDGTTSLTTLGANTIYVAKYEDAGNLVWASRMGGAGSDFGFGIYASYNWDILSTGYFANNADFDPDGGGDVLNSLGLSDGYVHKFSQTCVAPTVVSAAADISLCVTPGADVELSVIGTLNDAVDWYWYSGTCGGTFEGTGATLTVNPTTTTSYFVRAEGACGALPLCETVLVDVDDVPPVITTAAVTEDVESGACYYVSENLTLPTVTDNCVVDTIFNDADLLLFPGTHTITWTAIDEAGNITQETQQVTIEDNESPSIDAPADITVSADINCQATGVVLGTPLAVDNCSVESIINDAPPTFPLGQTIVTWTAADPSGNLATDQQIITVVDDTDPSISGFPTDIIVSNDAAQCGAIVSWTSPSVSDNCPGSVIVQTQGLVSGSLFPVGITTVEYTATDGSGNEVVDSFTITVTDDENPTINAPVDVTVSANSFCTAIGVALGSPAPADNCAVQSVTNDAPPIFTLGTTVVTWTVTDDAGNQSTDTQIVTVEDNENPTIIPPADITVNVDPATCQGTIADLGTPITDDNCSVNTVSNDAPATFPVGSTTVTWTVEDGSGNISTDTQTITVIDDINPTIIDLPSDITVVNDLSLCSALVSWTEPTADDNCPGATITQTGGVTNGGIFPVGTNIVEYTVTDASGNSVQGTFVVTVIDDEDPTIVAASDTLIEANQFCSAINVVLNSPTTGDNCGIVSITNDAPVIFDLDTTIVTWTVIDAAGNIATDTQLVIVVDSIAPVVSSSLPVTAYVNENCEIIGDSIVLVIPNASDNCAVDTIYNDLPDTLTTGTYTVTWFAEDVAGNIGSSTQMLTILDTIAPIPVLVDTVITLSTSGPIVLIGGDIDQGSTDNCGVAEVIIEQELFDCNDLGVNTIGVRVIDVNGNVTDTSIVVEVLESGIDLDFDGIDDACDDNVNTTVVVVPSGFTPNGDGINDLFVITALDNFDQVELFVYNRYGNLVYESQQYENNWDGTSSKNGMELPDGTYYYVLQLDGQAQRNGYVYINRTL